MRILVIEDNGEKADALKALVVEVDQRATFKVCGDIRSAFLELSATMFDLVVLDLMMPLTEDGEPQDSGEELLQIVSSSPLNRTARVVALTAFEDLYEQQEAKFAELGVLLVHYSDASEGWKKTIRSMLMRVSARRRCDFVVVCALDIERNAFGSTRAHMGEQKTENGLDVRQLRIGGHIGNCILLPRPGLVDASVITACAVERYRPRLVAMSGICAGVEERVQMGQVLVCETCWEYQIGKFTKDGFEFEPYQSSLPEAVRQRLGELCQSEDLVDSIYEGAERHKVKPCQPMLATIVSGSAVVANEDVRKRIQSQHRKIDAIEMEFAGVFRAVSLVNDSVTVVGVKAVVDFADHHKSDDIHETGARASAIFLVEAIDELLAG